jgi:hypothetical protein
MLRFDGILLFVLAFRHVFKNSSAPADNCGDVAIFFSAGDCNAVCWRRLRRRHGLIAFYFPTLMRVDAGLCYEQESVFIISDPSHRNVSRHAVLNLMIQQDIVPSQLRLLNDVGLLRLAQLAAVGGVSRWKRENGTRIVLNNDGAMTHAYSPGAVESDVMLCIICVLLTFIAMNIKRADVF